MCGGKLLSPWRGAVVVMLLLGLCTAGRGVAPPSAWAQTIPAECPNVEGQVCPSLRSTFNNFGITRDASPSSPDGLGFNGTNATYSWEGLAGSGAHPGGLVVSQDVTFTMPDVAANTVDNTIALGQTISMTGSGTIGFLMAASYGTSAANFISPMTFNVVNPGNGYFNYATGPPQPFQLTSPDWSNLNLDNRTTGGGDGTRLSLPDVQVAVATGYTNNAPNDHVMTAATIFSQIFQLDPARTLVSVTLPDMRPIWAAVGPGLGGTGGVGRVPPGNLRFGPEDYTVGTTGTALHIFAVATTGGVEPKPVLSPDVSVGFSHACAIAGRIFCWGSNAAGELGTGENTDPMTTGTVARAFTTRSASAPGEPPDEPPPTSPALPPAQVAAGSVYTCMLNASSVAYCLGANDTGQLGNGTDAQTDAAVQVSGGYGFRQISASFNDNEAVSHTCAIATSSGNADQAFCWGDNYYGQLGNPTLPPGENGRHASWTPAPVTIQIATALGPPNETPPPYGFFIAGLNPEYPTFGMISAGTGHTCGVATTGFAYCWGDNTHGQLGCSTVINPDACLATVDSPVGVDTTGLLQDKTVTQIAAGDTHTCAVTSDGFAYCWGDNTYGQLGDGTTGASSVPVQVRPAPDGAQWEQITAGSGFTCALTKDGDAYCWGRGNLGQLGAGSGTQQSSTPVKVTAGAGTELPSGTFLTQISSGFSSTCARDEESYVYCWGNNGSGQLGNGTETDSYFPVRVIFGALMITVPADATLDNPGTPGGAASGDLGEVTVTDDRAAVGGFVPGQWVVTVSASSFTSPPPPASPSSVIPAGDVTYTIAPGSFTDENPEGATPHNDASEGQTLGGTPPPFVTADQENAPIYAVTWDPEITVPIPYGAPAGAYQGEIMHSVE